MIALYILAALILLVAVTLAIPASVSIEYRDEVRVALSLLGFRLWQHPKKKKPVDLRSYTPEAIERRRRREARKKRRDLIKRQKKEKSKTSRQTEKKPKKKRGLLESISLIKKIAAVILAKTAKHTRIKLHRLDIAVATDDAAKTAILFGAVNQGAVGLLEFLRQSGNLSIPHDARVSVRADFTAQKSTADVYVVFSLRVWQLADILLGTGIRFIKEMLRKKKVPRDRVNTSENAK